MLRIQRVGLERDRVVLALQGHITADGVELLQRECWEAIRSGLRVTLDLVAVGYIAWPGLKALRRLRGIGVEIGRCSPLLADLLEHEGTQTGRAVDDANDGEVPEWKGGAPDA
jgi:hypothetical protein